MLELVLLLAEQAVSALIVCQAKRTSLFFNEVIARIAALSEASARVR